MSKRDRKNRGSWHHTQQNSQREGGESEFDDVMDEFSSSIDAMNADFERTLERSLESDVVVTDDDDDDGPSSLAILAAKLREIFCNVFGGAFRFCWNKTHAAAGSTMGMAIFLGRNAIWPVKKLISFMPTWTSGGEDDNDTESEEAQAEVSVTMPTKAERPQSATVDAADMLADYDEEEEETAALFASWKKWTLRSGVVAAVITALTAVGYFGYNAFENSATEIAQVQEPHEDGAETGNGIIETQTTPSKPGLPDLSATEPPTTAPSEANSATDNSATNIKSAPEESKSEDKTQQKTPSIPKPVLEQKIPATNNNAALMSPNVVAKNDETTNNETKNAGFPLPLAENEPKKSLDSIHSPIPATETASPDPWAANSSPTPPPSSATARWENSTASDAPTTPEIAAPNAWAPTEAPVPSTPNEVTKSTEANSWSKTEPKAEMPRINPEPLAELSQQNSGSQNDESKIVTPENVMPAVEEPLKILASTSPKTAFQATPPADDTPLKPLATKNETILASAIDEPSPAIPSLDEPVSKMSFTDVTKNTSTTSATPGLLIPDTSKSELAFGHAPTPPALAAAPPMNTPLMPPVQEMSKEEMVPVIAHAGTIQAREEFYETKTNSRPTEPVPALPGDPEPRQDSQTIAAFSKPMPLDSVTPTDASPSKDAYSPPSFANPLKAHVTSSTPLPEMDRADVPAIPVTPLLPQQAELAKSEAPLGSNLQNQLQEMSEEVSAVPRIRFTRENIAMENAIKSGAETIPAHSPPKNLTPHGGAVAFDPGRSRNNMRSSRPDLLPMPSSDDEATALATLLPQGQYSVTNIELPNLDAAPQSVMASSGPSYGYGHVGSQGEPRPATTAMAAHENFRAEIQKQRAVSFQQRLDSEIKQSPLETEQYVVQDGDTYMTICDRVFGTSLLFRALAEHNRKTSGVAYMPEAGTVIEIPPADFLRNNYGDSMQRGYRRVGSRNHAPGQGGIPTGISATNLPPTAQNGYRYITQDGDTAFNIATDRLKDTSLWRGILALNAGKIRDPKSQIPAGTEILLPVQYTAQTNPVRR